MKYIDADRLRAKLDEHYRKYQSKYMETRTPYTQGLVDALDLAEQVIDFLQQEQPSLPGIEENGIPGKDFIPVEWVDACEMYGKWKIVKVEQPDFPTTDEQIKEFLATHPEIKVPEKYKNPDWLFKKQEKPEVDFEKEWDEFEDWVESYITSDYPTYYAPKDIARHFYELGSQSNPEVFDTMAFQKGVQEGRRLEREDVKSIIQSRIDEILGDAQPNPILRMELQELIKKIEA